MNAASLASPSPSSSSSSNEEKKIVLVPHPETVDKVAQFFRNIWELPSNIWMFGNLVVKMDIKERFDAYEPSAANLVTRVPLIPSRACHLVGDTKGLEAIFEYHRNDPNGMFMYPETRKKSYHITLDLFDMLHPVEGKYQMNDCILTCQKECSPKFRNPLIIELSVGKVKEIYAEQISVLVSETLQRWASMPQPLNMTHELKVFPCTVISKLFLGFHPTSSSSSSSSSSDQDNVDYADIAAAIDMVSEGYMRNLTWRYFDKETIARAQVVMHKAIKDAYDNASTPLTKHLREMENHPDPQRRLSEKESKLLLCTLFLAGQETSATVLTELFWDLANNQEYQGRMAAEIQEKRTVDSPKLLRERAHECQTIVNALLEALRMKPPVFAIGRVCREDTTVEERVGETVVRSFGPIPGGNPIQPCPYLAARDPAKYPEPERFLPDRHPPLGGKHPTKSVPWFVFGAGAHFCPGRNVFWEEAVQLLFQMIGSYRIATPLERKPACKGMATERFVEDLLITLTPR